MVGCLQSWKLVSRGPVAYGHQRQCFIRPSRVSGPSRRVIVRSQPFTELKPWQRKRLETAAELSKKKTNVKEIAGDLEMSREEVLHFVGWLRSLSPETRESMKDSREAAEDAMAEHKQLLREKEKVADAAEKLTFQEVNDLKSVKRKQAITSRQEESLEKIYSTGTSWPSNELVQEISQLAGMHRNAVKRWFEDRRKSKNKIPNV